jgi:ribose 5-phosphate isomerase A
MMVEGLSQDDQKKLVARAAAERVEPGMVLGLGTGTTIDFFIADLPDAGVPLNSITIVPTSRRSADRAAELGLNVVSPAPDIVPDLLIDGADEVSRDFNMIKGGGGAMLWEKIVATASKRRVFIADDTKLVDKLGAFPLPLCTIRFGRAYSEMMLLDMGVKPVLRLDSDGAPWVTDSGNYIFDCSLGEIEDPAGLDRRLCGIPGVVSTGLFIGLLDELITVRDGAAVTITPKDGAFW